MPFSIIEIRTLRAKGLGVALISNILSLLQLIDQHASLIPDICPASIVYDSQCLANTLGLPEPKAMI